MNCAVFYTVALACCIGLALADWDALGYGSSYGYGGFGKASYVPVSYLGGGAAKGGLGSGGLLAMIGFLFLFFFLFGNNTNNQDQIVLINSTLAG